MRGDKEEKPKRSAREMVELLEQYPTLQVRLEELVGVVENAAGDAVKADEAEERVTEEIRRIGKTAMECWAERKNRRVTAEADRRRDLSHKEKKRSIGTPDTEG
jgi:hypothetical protein